MEISLLNIKSQGGGKHQDLIRAHENTVCIILFILFMHENQGEQRYEQRYSPHNLEGFWHQTPKLKIFCR